MFIILLSSYFCIVNCPFVTTYYNLLLISYINWAHLRGDVVGEK